MTAPDHLSRRSVLLLAIASAIVTANAYYIHPIIGRVAEDFGVSHGLVGAVPAFNQIALALGVFFLLPLGDQMSNRRLATLCLSVQVVSLLVMAIATDFWWFVTGSTLLGFFTVTPYLLPAYASKRVPPSEIGAVTTMLTTGVIAGVLLSRTGAGAIGEHLGWRNVYWLAAALMLFSTLMMPRIMQERIRQGAPPKSYFGLIASMAQLVRQHPSVLTSGLIQGLSFGVFLAVWMGIGVHLTSPELGYGLDDVGYLAAFSAVNLLTTPRLGRWADRIGPRRARMIVSVLQVASVLTLFVTGYNIWLLALSIAMMSMAGPMIDITSRMTCLNQPPAIRTRLMSIYIVLMFVGGGIGSWAGTIAYDLGGWNGSATLAVCVSLIVFTLSFLTARRETHA